MSILPRPPAAAVAPPYPPPVPGSTPRPHTDPELIASLAPLAEDHLARLVADRERHGAAAATILAASRMARYYNRVHVIVESTVDDARRAGVL
jgi:hypothetical protein